MNNIYLSSISFISICSHTYYDDNIILLSNNSNAITLNTFFFIQKKMWTTSKARVCALCTRYNNDIMFSPRVKKKLDFGVDVGGEFSTSAISVIEHT